MSEASCGEGLPTTHARRIELRDAKMWRRETERAMRTGQSKSRCPCMLCLFGKPLLRTTHALHLRDYGRHPLKRLQPHVISLLATPFRMFSDLCMAGSKGRVVGICNTSAQNMVIACVSIDAKCMSGEGWNVL